MPKKGYKQTEEHKRKRVEARQRNGQPWHSDAIRAIMSVQRIGRPGTMTGRKLTPEQRRKIGEANSRRVFTPEILENMAAAQRGKSWTEEQRREHIERLKARVAAGEWRNPILLPHDEEKRRERLSRSHKGIKQSPEWVANKLRSIAKSLLAKPNRLEARAGAALTLAFPDAGFFYNNECVIGRKMPDFLRRDGMPIAVDMHGDYWHRGEDVNERVAAYEENGYTLVVVWESEFDRDPNILIERVRIAEQDYSRKAGLTTLAKEA